MARCVREYASLGKFIQNNWGIMNFILDIHNRYSNFLIVLCTYKLNGIVEMIREMGNIR